MPHLRSYRMVWRITRGCKTVQESIDEKVSEKTISGPFKAF